MVSVKSQKTDLYIPIFLQRFQNEALKICTKVKVHEHVRIEDLHSRCNIVSLEQRRRIQLLLLMYKKSKDITRHKVFVRDTRISRRIVFKTDAYEGTLYKKSPYFVGAKLWDELALDVIELPDVYSFKARLKCLNAFYNDPLV